MEWSKWRSHRANRGFTGMVGAQQHIRQTTVMCQVGALTFKYLISDHLGWLFLLWGKGTLRRHARYRFGVHKPQDIQVGGRCRG